MVGLVLLLVVGGLYATQFLADVVKQPLFPVFAIPLAGTFAILLYWLRTRTPFIYGVLEIVFSLVVLGVTLFNPVKPELSQLGIAVAGALYIWVRGMDNMSKQLPEWLAPLWPQWFPAAKAKEGLVEETHGERLS